MSTQLRVMLVDSDPDDRQLARAVLEQKIPAVVVVEVGDALVFAERLMAAPPDVVVTEHRLPWGDGFGILATVRALHPRSAVVLFTAAGSEQVAAECVRAGMDGYLAKSSAGFLRLAEEVRGARERAGRRRGSRDDERAHIERELAEREAALARADSELREFAYVVSHDLQEPVQLVARFAALLAEQLPVEVEGDARRHVEHIVDSAGRMQAMIDGILAYARVDTRGQEPAATDVAKVVDDAVANLKGAIDAAGATVSCGPMPTVAADASQMLQVFQNLVGNAVKFRSTAPPVVRISAEERVTEWLFSVVDNGIGIAPEQCDRVFGMFQRLHAASEVPGTGIGLAICKRIVERHGGRIWVTSDPGRGSTFSFSIPKAAGRGPYVAAPSRGNRAT